MEGLQPEISTVTLSPEAAGPAAYHIFVLNFNSDRWHLQTTNAQLPLKAFVWSPRLVLAT